MARAKDSRRENFEVNAEQQAEIETLQELLNSPSKKDAVLAAVQFTLHLAAEIKKGNQVFVGDPAKKDLQRFVFLGIEKPFSPTWKYLRELPHPWKRQLYVKGRKLPAAAVWTASQVNKLSHEEAAKNWSLPLDAIREIFAYCETHRELLEMESEEERRILLEKDFDIGA